MIDDDDDDEGCDLDQGHTKQGLMKMKGMFIIVSLPLFKQKVQTKRSKLSKHHQWAGGSNEADKQELINLNRMKR